MARKPTGNPNGRPPKTAEAEAVADEAERTGAPVGEVAKRRGVGRSTAFAAKAKRRAGKGAPAPRRRRSAAPARPATPSPPADRQAASTGIAEGGPLERLRAYAAHDAGALAALEALVASPDGGITRDELADLREGLRLAGEVVRDAAADREPGEDGPLLRALQRLEGLAKTVATVKARRPPEQTEDLVTKRLCEARDAAIERVGILTSEAAAKLASDRTAFAEWCDGLGAIGGEVRARVEAMLGEGSAS